MASHPPGQCCVQGVKHEGEAVGQFKDIGNTSTYFSYPKDNSTKNAILFLTDVLGHKFINAQLMADQFAANGYFVVMPDLFQGDPKTLNPPEGFDQQKWREGPPGKTPEDVDPIITKVIHTMRSTYNVVNLGAVGYCFGGKYVARFLGSTGASNNATINVGFTAHPSNVDESELKAITGPLSIAAAETDRIFPPEKRHRSEEILKGLSDGELKLPYQVTLYSSCSHGFAVRGDLSDRRVRFAKEAAFLQAVGWFDYYLKG